MEELNAIPEREAATIHVESAPEDSGGVGARALVQDGQEGDEAEEDCYAGTCACKVTYVPSGKPVPPDAFAMSIRDNEYEGSWEPHPTKKFTLRFVPRK